MKHAHISTTCLFIAALIVSGGEAALAQVIQPSRAPSHLPTTLPARGAMGRIEVEPQVNRATPRALTVSIGAEAVTMTLNGSQLGPVSAVQVVDAAGNVQPNIEASIVAHARAAHTLTLHVFARQHAPPGQYRLQLMLPRDPNQIDNRPANAPLGAVPMRALQPLPANIAAIAVRKLEPKIDPIPTLQYGTQIRPTFRVTDVPGSEIQSITRYEDTGLTFCRYQSDAHLAVENPAYRGDIASAIWRAPNTLEILFNAGQFEPYSTCQIQFSIRTRNARGEEFHTFTPRLQLRLSAPPPPKRLAVSSTWALKNYLHLPTGFRLGVCSGNSLGAHGSFPVGLINVNGRIGFRARSGPIGTQCEWTVATNRLEPGWTLHLDFRIKRIGDKCRAGPKSNSQFDFSRLNHAIIQSDGEISLASNLNHNGNAMKIVELHCEPTLSNDHEVLVEIASASVSKQSVPQNCDWRCAFR